MNRLPATKLRRAALIATVSAVALTAAPAARAEDSATVKLIELLISKGILSRDQAASLLSQAQSEARVSKAVPKKGAEAAPAAAAAAAAPAAADAPVPPGAVRVTYVPQVVRDQIAAEVRQQVLGQARAENWAAPNALPEWTKRIKIYGDVRVRSERILQDGSNKDSAPFTDFNSINNGSAFDVLGSSLPPILNTTEDRTRYQLRARLGMTAQIDDWVSSDIRIATGNSNSPVSTNQTFGSPGYFSKYAIWLDRAYLKLEPLKNTAPFQSLKIFVGRAPNPFWTTDLVYDTDVNFDGISVTGSYPVNDKLEVFGTVGGYSVFNTDLNFSSLNLEKFPSRDKYLFGIQGGVTAKPVPSVVTKLAAGFFDYINTEGKTSAACEILYSGIGCSTDGSRTQFYQFGNTLFPIRNIVGVGGAAPTSAPQYFGLASRYHIFDMHGRVDYLGFPIAPVALEGEFSKNFGFNRNFVVSRGPVNNLGSNSVYQGGDTGYTIKLTVGKTEVAERWDWNAFVQYKYLESDAVLDALTDSDFHLGGTNAKGFVLGGDLGIARNLYLAGRWYSASEISGPSYRNDVLQLDLNARF